MNYGQNRTRLAYCPGLCCGVDKGSVQPTKVRFVLLTVKHWSCADVD